MTRTATRLSVSVSVALMLAACGEEQSARDPSGDRRTAAGEVRGGTISDAMLPLDTVRSQNPPLTAGSADGTGGSASGATAPPGEADGNVPDDPDAAIDALEEDLADDAAAATGDYEL